MLWTHLGVIAIEKLFGNKMTTSGIWLVLTQLTVTVIEMSLPVSNSTRLDELWIKIWLNLQKRHSVVSLIYFSKDLLGEKESLIRCT